MDTTSNAESVVALTPRCQLWYIGEIRELLSEANLSTLRESCLGHLMDIHEIQFQGELIKLLCKRLHSTSLDKNTLAFNFGDHEVQFGGADFCVMTGLKFSGETALPKHSKFHGLVFLSRTNLVFADIEKEFRKECDASDGKSVRSLKLAYLLLIYGLLVFNDQDTGKVDVRYLYLMDDLKMFNAYPWGLVSYQYLVGATHRLKRALSSVGQDMQAKSLEAYGFLYTLQCWAYEVIPALGTYCATLNTQHLSSFPRILKWIVSRNLNFKDDGLRKFFWRTMVVNPYVHYVRMSLSSSEINKLGDLGITPSMHVASPAPLVDLTKNVGRKLDFGSCDGNKSNTKKQSSKRKSSRLGSSPKRSGSAKSIDLEDCVFLEPQDVKGYIPRSKNNKKGVCFVSEGTPRSDSNSNTNFLTPEAATVVGDVKLNDITMMFLSLKGQMKCLEESIELKLKHFEVLLNKSTHVVGCSCDSKVHCSEGIVWDGLPATVRKHSLFNSGVSRTIDCEISDDRNEVADALFKSKSGVVGAADVVQLSSFHPNDTNVFCDELERFAEWVRDPTISMREKLILLPTEIFQYADLAWLNILWRHDGWLDNMHLDALINSLIINFDKQRSLQVRRNWVCLEICCWQALTRTSMVDVTPVVMPYVLGERPVSGGLRWCEVDNLFGIANLNNCHWVFFDVSLVEQVITVYNSMEENWESILPHFAEIRTKLPIICSLGGLWETSTHVRKPLKTNWNVVKYSGAPKQTNLSDCGIMAMKYMECRAHNFPVSKINPICCKEFRRCYCAQLFALSKELMVNSVES